jgi:hypothetical protein
MKSFFSELVPKLYSYSQKLDNKALLVNQQWILLNDENSTSLNLYIFRDNNELLISKDGQVLKAKWDYVGDNTLIVDTNSSSELYHLGFFDKNLLVLRLASLEDRYIFFVNSSGALKFQNMLLDVNNYLHSIYVNKKVPSTVSNLKPVTQKVAVSIKTDKGIIQALLNYRDDMPAVGDRILKNGYDAPDGSYRLGFMQYIYVVNGVIVQTSAF